MTRRQRSDYNEMFAKSLYQLRKAELLIDEITDNPNYNPKGLTSQRISIIIKTYEKKLAKGTVNE